MHLFDPLKLRDLSLRNRIAVSPMCQYSSQDGFASDWHLVHLGSRAVGGAALVIAEATAVEARGRISPSDLGIYHEAHIETLRRINHFIHEQGSIAGVQLSHAGRKASTARPWEGRHVVDIQAGGWRPVVAPSAIPFAEDSPVPEALDEAGIRDVIRAFAEGARRALAADFRVVEIHAAHGYLLHEFLSPLANRRTDGWGGDFAGRTRLLCEVTDAIRAVWPERLPLLVRISATDWAEGGWDIEQSVELARVLKERGVDLIDVSSGGLVSHAKIPVAPGYQASLAERIRRDAGIAVGAVGLITDPQQADDLIRNERADLVLIARELLRDPYWPMRAARKLGHAPPVPPQYLRAW